MIKGIGEWRCEKTDPHTSQKHTSGQCYVPLLPVCSGDCGSNDSSVLDCDLNDPRYQLRKDGCNRGTVLAGSKKQEIISGQNYDTWKCQFGSSNVKPYGGTNPVYDQSNNVSAKCSILVGSPENGVCESTHHNCKTTATSTNTQNNLTEKWTWTCPGSNSGTDASCIECKSGYQLNSAGNDCVSQTQCPDDDTLRSYSTEAICKQRNPGRSCRKLNSRYDPNGCWNVIAECGTGTSNCSDSGSGSGCCGTGDWYNWEPHENHGVYWDWRCLDRQNIPSSQADCQACITANGFYESKSDCENAPANSGKDCVQLNAGYKCWQVKPSACNPSNREYDTKAECQSNNSGRQCQKHTGSNCWGVIAKCGTNPSACSDSESSGVDGGTGCCGTGDYYNNQPTDQHSYWDWRCLDRVSNSSHQVACQKCIEASDYYDTETRCQTQTNKTCTKGHLCWTPDATENGQCGTTHYDCGSTLSAKDKDGNTHQSKWTWTCPGSNGGTDDSCFECKSGYKPNQAGTDCVVDCPTNQYGSHSACLLAKPHSCFKCKQVSGTQCYEMACEGGRAGVPDCKEVNGRCLPSCGMAAAMEGFHGHGPDGIQFTCDDPHRGSNSPCSNMSDHGHTWVDVDPPGDYLGVGDHWDASSHHKYCCRVETRATCP